MDIGARVLRWVVGERSSCGKPGAERGPNTFPFQTRILGFRPFDERRFVVGPLRLGGFSPPDYDSAALRARIFDPGFSERRT
jgi:hypothetical protein